MFDDQYFNLDYTHDEIETLLDKINNGCVLSNDEYEKLIQIGLDNISTFSGDYDDLINKPDLLLEISNSIEQLNIETSDSIEQKLALLKNTVEKTMQDYLENKADIQHLHKVEDIEELQSKLNSKAEFFHSHNDYITLEELKDELDKIENNVSVDLTNYVTNDIMNEALNNKANKTHIHTITDVENLQESLDNKVNKDETLSKEEINSMVSNKADLVHDHDEYYDKEEVDDTFVKVTEYLECLEDYALKSELASKSDIIHNHDSLYYLKEEIDDKLSDIATNGEIDLTIYAKKADVDVALIGKADAMHIHDISGIQNLQDSLDAKLEQNDVEQMIKDKANIEHTHAEYVSIDNVNALLDEHKQVIEDGISEELLNYTTQEQLKSELALKSDYDHRHDIDYSPLVHEHDMSGISGLQEALDEKANIEDVAFKDDLKEKADIVHNHNDLYYDKNEIDNKIEEGLGTIDLSEYAKTKYVDEALATKAESIHNHDISNITDLQNELDSKALRSDVYTKAEINEQMGKKSDVGHGHKIEEVENLQNELDSKADIEDVYDKTEIDDIIIDVNTKIDSKADVNHKHDDIYSKLGHVHETNDITDLFDKVFNKDEIEDLLAEKSDLGHKHKIEEIEELQSKLDLKANVEDVYNKTEIENKVSDLNDKIDAKADAGHDHDDDYAALQHKHGIEDITNILDSFYTETEVDDLLAEKSDVGHGHKIPEIEGLSDELNKKVDLENVYNKTEVDEIVDTINEAIDGKADVKHGHDITSIEGLQSVLDLKADKENTYTKNDIDNTVNDLRESIDSKADAGHDHDDDYAPLTHNHVANEITDLFDNVHTKEEIKNLLAEKSDSDHNHDLIYSKLDHIHLAENITDLYNNIYNKTEVDEKIAGKSDEDHTHDMSVITGLEEALALKASIEEMNKKASKEELETGLLTKSDESHRHDDIYAPLVHNHDDSYYTETEINSLLEKAIDDARIISVAEANAHSDEAIANLVDSAPDAMNTLNELAQAINNHQEIYDAYVETVTKSLSSKSDVGHDHNTIYYTRQEVDNKISEGIDGIDFTTYALKTEMNTALAAKAELKHTHEAVDITNLQEILDAKADSMNAATKEEIEALESLIAGKASVDHDHNNDYYTKTQIDENITNKLNSIDHSAYALKTEVEAALGSKSDADHKHEGVYLEKNEVENLIGDAIAGADLPSYATKDLLNTELAKKASVSHTHDQSEIEDLITTLESKVDDTQLDLYTTKVQVNAALAKKSDAEHNHDEKYSKVNHVHDVTTLTGMYTNFYTKTQVENRLAEKADSTHKHKIEEVTDLQKNLDNKANSSDVYTKSEVNSSLALKLDAAVKQEIDAAIDLKLDKADINTITNEIIDNAFNSIAW